MRRKQRRLEGQVEDEEQDEINWNKREKKEEEQRKEGNQRRGWCMKRGRVKKEKVSRAQAKRKDGERGGVGGQGSKRK